MSRNPAVQRRRHVPPFQPATRPSPTAFLFRPPCSWEAVLLAAEATRTGKQAITTDVRLFFTLYILSIFTHEMYMIGMHIIFLLTNGFNKAPSTCCNRGRLSFRSPRRRLVSVATNQRRGATAATSFSSGIEECLEAKKRLHHFPVFQLFVLYKHRKFLVKYLCEEKF